MSGKEMQAALEVLHLDAVDPERHPMWRYGVRHSLAIVGRALAAPSAPESRWPTDWPKPRSEMTDEDLRLYLVKVSEEGRRRGYATAVIARDDLDALLAMAALSTPEPSGPKIVYTTDEAQALWQRGYDAGRAAPSTEPALDGRLRAFVEHRVGLAALQHPDDWRERDVYLASAADAVSEHPESQP